MSIHERVPSGCRADQKRKYKQGEFDTQDTGPAYIRMRVPLARGPLYPILFTGFPGHGAKSSQVYT
jgi:hypothetical protein